MQPENLVPAEYSGCHKVDEHNQDEYSERWRFEDAQRHDGMRGDVLLPNQEPTEQDHGCNKAGDDSRVRPSATGSLTVRCVLETMMRLGQGSRWHSLPGEIKQNQNRHNQRRTRPVDLSMSIDGHFSWNEETQNRSHDQADYETISSKSVRRYQITRFIVTYIVRKNHLYAA